VSTDGLAAALADRYAIERELGQGGMATVYLAQDLKHDRKVAIKVLKPELAAVLGAERFVQEIKTTAALSHPHILPLFDSGEAGGFLYYVMPYIEGETLRERLNRDTQLGIDEAVRITSEVADALDYAHRHGVIHRDIKPENILLHDGRPMVMDFGIALALSAAAGGRMTETGMSLGTPHYMSPEQATADKAITARSDIYSLASVLYEMLAGNPPHVGASAQQIIMKIIAEPVKPVSELRKSVPANVGAAVARGLEKLPADRFASAQEFAHALANPAFSAGGVAGSPAGAMHSPVSRHIWLLAGGAVLAGLALAAGWFLRGRATTADGSTPVEFAFELAHPGDRPYVAISRDGGRIGQLLYDSAGVARIAVRELGSVTPRVIPGTDGASDFAFSPDGAWVAFTRNGQVVKVPSAGGPATVLADSADGTAPAWSRDGSFLLYALNSGGLGSVSSAGGGARRVTTVDRARREFNHWNADVLPGNKVALFTSYATPLTQTRIEAVTLASGKRTVVVTGAVFARYVTGGFLLFARDSAVFAVRFDPATLMVSGQAVPVRTDVASIAPDGISAYGVADNGTLAYVKQSEWQVSDRVVWVDRSGRAEAALPDSGNWAEPKSSLDGRWIALTQTQPKRDIWLYDRGRRILSQLTHAPASAFGPVWMPDSRAIVYSYEDPVYDLHRLTIDASAPDAAVLSTSHDKRALSASPDGRTVLFTENRRGDRLGFLTPPDSATMLMDDPTATQSSGAFSPDGRWLAFDNAVNGERPDVFVRPFGRSGGRVQVSSGGGSQPRWTRGGHEVVYRRGDVMMAAPFDPASGNAGTPGRLFSLSDVGRLDNRAYGYDVTPDGMKFLMVTPIPRTGAQPVHVILHWTDRLKAQFADHAR
jgi:serine/threonine-protein kinase